MTEVLIPWSSQSVMRMLDRYWELRHSSRVSNPGAIGGIRDCDGHEMMYTVASWVTMIDRGCRTWYPKRNWGKYPIVIRWLIAKDAAQERNVLAENTQRDAMTAGIMKHDHVKEAVSRLWRRAEKASVESHRIEHYKNFEIMCGWLGIAFSMCAMDDWTFRRMEYNQRPIDRKENQVEIGEEEVERG